MRERMTYRASDLVVMGFVLDLVSDVMGYHAMTSRKAAGRSRFNTGQFSANRNAPPTFCAQRNSLGRARPKLNIGMRASLSGRPHKI